ncbi:hypothetical protein MRX96_005309 [Rhipicephalus microplus]
MHASAGQWRECVRRCQRPLSAVCQQQYTTASAARSEPHGGVRRRSCVLSSSLLRHALPIAIAPGEGQVRLSLLYDEHADELALPQTYFGNPREMRSSRATPFSKAPSEMRCSDYSGVEPAHIFYMAVKVIWFNVVEKTATIRTNDVSNTTRQQLWQAVTS